MKVEFDYKEKGVVGTVTAIAAALIVIGMITAIGLAIMAEASTTAQTSINSLPTAVQTDANAALAAQFTTVNTVSGYYPLLFLAIIGGVALTAFMGYMVFGRGKSGGSSGSL